MTKTKSNNKIIMSNLKPRVESFEVGEPVQRDLSGPLISRSNRALDRIKQHGPGYIDEAGNHAPRPTYNRAKRRLADLALVAAGSAMFVVGATAKPVEDIELARAVEESKQAVSENAQANNQVAVQQEARQLRESESKAGRLEAAVINEIIANPMEHQNFLGGSVVANSQTILLESPQSNPEGNTAFVVPEGQAFVMNSPIESPDGHFVGGIPMDNEGNPRLNAAGEVDFVWLPTELQNQTNMEGQPYVDYISDANPVDGLPGPLPFKYSLESDPQTGISLVSRGPNTSSSMPIATGQFMDL